MNWTDMKSNILFAFLLHEPELLEHVTDHIPPRILRRKHLKPEWAAILRMMRTYREEYGDAEPMAELLQEQLGDVLADMPADEVDEQLEQNVRHRLDRLLGYEADRLAEKPELGRRLVRKFIFDFYICPRLQSASQSAGSPEEVREVLREVEDVLASDADNQPEALDVEAMVQEIQNQDEGLRTGWWSLDEQGVRLRPRQLSIVAARLGHGKTALLLNLAHNTLDRDEEPCVLFISLETPPTETFLEVATITIKQSDPDATDLGVNQLRKTLRKRGAGDMQAMYDSQLIDAQLTRLSRFEDRLWIHYVEHAPVDRLVSQVKAVSERVESLDLVLLDYLQLVSGSEDQYDRRDIEVGRVCQRLKGLAVDLDIPVVAAAQINRQPVQNKKIPHNKPIDDEDVQEAITRRQPQVHHLREADQIGQYADLVLGLQNEQEEYLEALPPEKVDRHNSETANLRINVLKSRFGRRVGTILELDGASGAILEPYSRDEQNMVDDRRKRELGKQLPDAESSDEAP